MTSNEENVYCCFIDNVPIIENALIKRYFRLEAKLFEDFFLSSMYPYGELANKIYICNDKLSYVSLILFHLLQQLERARYKLILRL